MTDYGTEAWKSYLEILVKCVAAAQTQLAKLKYAYIFKTVLCAYYQKCIFQKTDSRSKFPTQKRTNAGWRETAGFGSQLGRISEQEL
jgi:hypothetical protein